MVRGTEHEKLNHDGSSAICLRRGLLRGTRPPICRAWRKSNRNLLCLRHFFCGTVVEVGARLAEIRAAWRDTVNWRSDPRWRRGFDLGGFLSRIAELDWGDPDSSRPRRSIVQTQGGSQPYGFAKSICCRARNTVRSPASRSAEMIHSRKATLRGSMRSADQKLSSPTRCCFAWQAAHRGTA